MKRVIVILIFFSLIVNLKAQVVQNVDAAKFKELIGKGDALLLDVRSAGEYSRGHIKGSTSIDLSDPNFESRIGLLQKDKTILVYCLSGSRSRTAANYMESAGFKTIYHMGHGLMEWNQLGYALEQSNEPIASSGKSYTEQIFSQLLKDNKVVLVDFQAVWCAPCKAMNPVIDQMTTDFKGKVRVEKIDVEANKAIATAYQVQSIPGFVIFKNGKKVWSHSGIISYDALAGELKKYL